MDHSRSRSPYPQSEGPRKRKRSRSPRRHRSEHKPDPSTAPVLLPLRARSLSRHDLRTHRPMFALYLDIQKQRDIEELSEDEVKGRWKSFMGKWNRGELAEGWYDPKTLEKAQAANDGQAAVSKPTSSSNSTLYPSRSSERPAYRSDDAEDDYGPPLPEVLQQSSFVSSRRAGPAIPNLDDLQIQQELRREDISAARRNELEDLRAMRKAERKLQSARLDELVPKAEAGSKERQLEKKWDQAEANKSFAAAKEGGGDVDLPEAEVMGGGDSLEELKRLKQANERKKNEREIRREEILRARNAEREERMRGMRVKEEKTMAMLREIATARFGSGNDEGATLGR